MPGYLRWMVFKTNILDTGIIDTNFHDTDTTVHEKNIGLKQELDFLQAQIILGLVWLTFLLAGFLMHGLIMHILLFKTEIITWFWIQHALKKDLNNV